MIARLTNQWIYLENITVWEEELLVERFSVENPNSRYIDNSAYQSWDGIYRKYSKKHKRLARPFLAELRLLCKNKNLLLSVKDERGPAEYQPIPAEEICDDFLPGITLKDFQVGAIRKVCTTECGVISITTGGGKSELMAAICKVMNCPTVIVAEQVVVIDQLRNRLSLRDVCDDPGLFYAGKMPTGELIIIGSIQSLVMPKKKPDKPTRDKYEDTKSSTAEQKFKQAIKRYKASLKGYKSRTKKARTLHKLIGKCEMILVDECDLAVGKTYQNLFRHWFKGRRRYGFTATPYDDYKPVQRMVLNEHLGSIIYQQNRTQVEDTGLIVPIEYYMFVFGENENPKDASAYDIALEDWMIYNKDYHLLVKAICDKYPDDGTLILVERHDLGHALKDLIPDSQFIYGNTPKKKRPEILKAFEKRDKKVLIGGKNVRRGLDLDGGCENLILATGGKLVSEFDQRIGRARRRNERGKSRVFDFFFLCNKYLYAHSRNRLKAAVEMGYKTKVIFRNGTIDGEEFVRSRFRRPRFPTSS
jgi:superfamily II DNA or RNA helicase